VKLDDEWIEMHMELFTVISILNFNDQLARDGRHVEFRGKNFKWFSRHQRQKMIQSSVTQKYKLF